MWYAASPYPNVNQGQGLDVPGMGLLSMTGKARGLLERQCVHKGTVIPVNVASWGKGSEHVIHM